MDALDVILDVLALIGMMLAIAGLCAFVGGFLAWLELPRIKMPDEPPEQCAPDYGRIAQRLTAEGGWILERERAEKE